jgi:hypothetical protein
VRFNGFVAGGHECIVALRACFDAAAQGRIDEPLLQILCLFPTSTLICPRVSYFVGFCISFVKVVGSIDPQRGWNCCTFPEQNEFFLNREALSASVETFELRPVDVVAETSMFRPARLDKFLHSLKQYILLGNGTEPIECDRG